MDVNDEYEFMFSQIRGEFCAYKLIEKDGGKTERILVATGNDARELRREVGGIE